MGLDMYLFRQNNNAKKEDKEEIGYWRKHSDLHGIMTNMYLDRDTSGEVFNCIPLELSKEDCLDILDLAVDIVEGRKESPTARGFFWGESYIEDWQHTIEIFKNVLETTDFENQTIYYNSWW